MADNLSPLSANPSSLQDPSGIVRLILTKFLQGVDDMLPAQIISYDRVANVAQVQPLILTITTDNIRIDRAQIAAVPAQITGGGGFAQSMPLNPGDLGWIKASDRDISLFKQFHKNSPPNTQRKHSFEDGVFIPDNMNQGLVIAGEDIGNAVWQNLAGTVKISLWTTFIKMLSRVGIGGNPDDNAIFDVQSTTKASMPWPRMTTTQRNAIPSPKEGMAIWNLTTHGLSVYNGTIWS